MNTLPTPRASSQRPLTPVEDEIRSVLNRYSAEAPSGTPDHILAAYLIDCLKAFNEAVSLRAEWRGEPCEFTPGGAL